MVAMGCSSKRQSLSDECIMHYYGFITWKSVDTVIICYYYNIIKYVLFLNANGGICVSKKAGTNYKTTVLPHKCLNI